MKILHVFKTYFSDGYGGVETVIRTLAEGVPEYGHSAEVLTTAVAPGERVATHGRHRVHRAARLARIASTDLSLEFFPMFRRLTAECDIIHYHFPWPLMDLAQLFLRPRRPVLVTYHSDIVRQKWLYRAYRPLQERFLRSADAIVATSPEYAASSPVLARHAARLRIIPLGIDPGLYAVDDARRFAWRSRLPGPFFLFVGALRHYKGLWSLLDAAEKYRGVVVIAGAGGEEERLRSHCRRRGLDHVVFVGAVDDADKAALLDLCTGVVLPSSLRSEAFGLVLAEALLFGKPAVSCAIGTGTSFVNRDGVTGLVVPPDDPRALAQAMRRLAGDAAMAGRMGAAGRRRFVELFTAEAMVRSYVRLYETLIAEYDRHGDAPARKHGG